MIVGRSIPSFRTLIDIERLNWEKFKEKLLDKEDKETFNKIFSIPKLYCHYLSNLSRPLIMEPILMSVLFHNFKDVSKKVDEARTSSLSKSSLDMNNQKNEENLSNFIAVAKNDKTWYKDYNYTRILEEWKEFSDCLSKEDESTFVEMISSCYDSFNLSINSIYDSSSRDRMNRNEKQRLGSSNTTSLFMALFLYQQKQLELIKVNKTCLDSHN